MAAEGDVLSEIEVLQSIYLDELRVIKRDDGGCEVSLVLYPSTAEDGSSQFVRLTLTLTLDPQYPTSPPSISIHNPRGLSDDKLSSVQDCLRTEAESCLGSPVLYQLIEKAKEILTESNIPHGNCVICLYGFKEGEVFSKTSCYHYYHSHCLGRYVSHAQTELRERERELEEDKTRDTSEDELTVVCPVCREPLTYDVNQLLTSPAPHFPKLEGATIGAEFRQKWHKFQKLLERQKAKGGIIDPEAESNRFLIHIYEPPADAENASTEVDVSPSQSPPSLPSASTTTVRAAQDPAHTGHAHTGHAHRRGGPAHRRPASSKASRRGGGERERGGGGGGGGGGRLLHGRPVYPTEHLDKLTLSSDAPRGASRQEGVVDGEAPSRPNPDVPKTDGQRDAPNPERGRGGRGRRRGPRSSAQHPGQWQERHWRGTDQWDAPGGMYHRWDGRGQRSGGGPGGGGGVARGGNGKAFRQRVTEGEVGREEVL